MVSMQYRFLFLLLCACGFAALVSCPVSRPPDPDPQWTFDAGIEAWWLVGYDDLSVNSVSTLSWSDTEGSPGAGALEILADFTKPGGHVSVVAPIAGESLIGPGMDLTGKKLTVRVKTSDPITANAFIFSNSGQDPEGHYPGGSSAAVSVDNTGWKTIEFDMTSPDPDYNPADMRFLGVLINKPGASQYTFYVDTAVISDAP